MYIYMILNQNAPGEWRWSINRAPLWLFRMSVLSDADSI